VLEHTAVLGGGTTISASLCLVNAALEPVSAFHRVSAGLHGATKMTGMHIPTRLPSSARGWLVFGLLAIFTLAGCTAIATTEPKAAVPSTVATQPAQATADEAEHDQKFALWLARIFHATPLYSRVGADFGADQGSSGGFAGTGPSLGQKRLGLVAIAPTPAWVAGLFGVIVRARHCMKLKGSATHPSHARRCRHWASWRPDTAECAACCASPPLRV
jgi:hypothetical protein